MKTVVDLAIGFGLTAVWFVGILFLAKGIGIIAKKASKYE